MKKFTKIYYVVVAVLAVLLVACSFLNVSMGAMTSSVSVETTKSYATALSNASVHDNYDDGFTTSLVNSRGLAVKEITTKLKASIAKKFDKLYLNNSSDPCVLGTSEYGDSKADFIRGEYSVTDEYGHTENKYELAPVYYSTPSPINVSDIERMPGVNVSDLFVGRRVQNVILYLPGTDTMNATRFENQVSIVSDTDKLEFTYGDNFRNIFKL